MVSILSVFLSIKQHGLILRRLPFCSPCESMALFHAATAPISAEEAVQEALADVDDLSECSPIAFDWDLSLIHI